MPWKASSVMEEKIRFVVEYEQDNYTMSELCRRYGIARETGYVWLRRYRGRGGGGRVELNRAALLHGNQTPGETGGGGGGGGQGGERGGARALKSEAGEVQAH